MGIMESLLGGRVYFDTNIFIYALEGFPEYIPSLTSLFAILDEREIKAITSELTLAEVLIKPYIDKNDYLLNVYLETITPSDSLDVIPVNRQILIEAARIRAESTTILLPDAIHLATARLHHCTSFITNDKRLKCYSNIRVIILSENL